MLLLQGHLAENNYDGYAPHHHMMLLNLTLPEYEAYYKSTGNIFPNASLKEKILNPLLLPSSFGRKLTGTFDRTLTSNMTALG